MTPGFALAKIGRMVPVLKDIGGPAILCLMMPSVLVYLAYLIPYTSGTVHLLMKRGQFTSILSSPVWWLAKYSGNEQNHSLSGEWCVCLFRWFWDRSGNRDGAAGGPVWLQLYHTFSLLLCRLSAAVAKGILPLSRHIRRSSGQRLMYVASWRRRRWWGISSPLSAPGFLASPGRPSPAAIRRRAPMIGSHDDNHVFCAESGVRSRPIFSSWAPGC